MYRGKQLNEENTLFDLGVNLKVVIQLWEIKPAVKESETSNDEDKQESAADDEKEDKKKEEKCVVVEEKTETEYFKIGDIVDIKDVDDNESAGAYFEGEIVRITVEEGENAEAGSDGHTYYVKYEAYDGEYKVKNQNMRPRAREILKPRALEVNTEVLCNYNLQEPGKRGCWFRGVVEKVKPLHVCLFVGVDETPVEGCKIMFPDEVFRLEKPVLVKERDEKLEIKMNTPVPRKHPPKCEVCMDNDKKKCKECGCFKCGGKNNPETILICDECQMGFHLKCLKMDTLPEDDEWFCPDCKNEDDTVKAGEKQEDGKKKKKMASKVNPATSSKRDWGKGFATVGRTKECKIVSQHHSGPIPGVEVGSAWLLRLQVSEAGIHRPHVAGIAGTAAEGCQSIVLSGGYEDDVDNGEEFTYTGSGGRDLSNNKRTAAQSSDQTLTKHNAAIAKSCNAPFNDKKGGDAGENWKKGKPIRVVRGYKGRKHSKYAPEEGCRYDGIYKCVKYWPENGQSGFLVWRYLFRRDDPAPAPWTEEGKKRIEEGGWGQMQYPENYHESQALKLKEKAAKLDAANNDKENKGKRGKKRVQSDAESDPLKAKISKNVPLSKYKISSDLVEAMKRDKKNSKLWEEIRSQEFKTRKELVDEVEKSFECVVCMGVVTAPVTLQCLHNFCQSCIKRGVKSEGAVCPCCRGVIDPKLEVNNPLNAPKHEDNWTKLGVDVER